MSMNEMVPVAPDIPDEYQEDPNYDPANDSIDPETMGHPEMDVAPAEDA